MQDNVSVLIATILFVVIIVIFPIYNVATRQDSMANNVVIKATTSFVDEIRNKGYLKYEDYETFIDQINATNNSYEVELEIHRKTIIQNKNGEYVEGYEKDYTKDVLKKMNSKVEIVSGMNERDALNKVADVISTQNSIEISNVYLLNEEDKIYVRVKNTNMTQAQVLLSGIFKGSVESKIVVNYGGEVYNSEWSKSNLSENLAANISLSRPKTKNGDEYTMKPIGVNSDEIEDEYLYGIAVPIHSSTDTIRIDLKYSNIEKTFFTLDSDFKVVSGNDLIVLDGFEGDVEIIKDNTAENTYNILISNIDTGNETRGTIGYIRIKEGTAITKNGELVGSAVSPEFIIYRDEEQFDIDDLKATSINPKGINVKTAGNLEPVDGKVTVEFEAPKEAKDGRSIKMYGWQISNAGKKPISIKAETGDIIWVIGEKNNNTPSYITTESNKIIVEFSEEEVTSQDMANNNVKGNYVKVIAMDENGIYSKAKGVAFGTIAGYMDKAVTDVIANVNSLKTSGATVSKATFNLWVSSDHHTSGTVNKGDRYRVIGVDTQGRKVILIDKEIEKISNVEYDASKNEYSTTSTGKKVYIRYDNNSQMYYIDDNNDGKYTSDEYYISNDIQLTVGGKSTVYSKYLGIKTESFDYANKSANDYSLYYWVKESLVNLEITVNDDAKNKYTNLIFDYKILAGHKRCIEGSSNIKCTVEYYFE